MEKTLSLSTREWPNGSDGPSLTYSDLLQYSTQKTEPRAILRQKKSMWIVVYGTLTTLPLIIYYRRILGK